MEEIADDVLLEEGRVEVAQDRERRAARHRARPRGRARVVVAGDGFEGVDLGSERGQDPPRLRVGRARPVGREEEQGLRDLSVERGVFARLVLQIAHQLPVERLGPVVWCRPRRALRERAVWCRPRRASRGRAVGSAPWAVAARANRTLAEDRQGAGARPIDEGRLPELAPQLEHRFGDVGPRLGEHRVEELRRRLGLGLGRARQTPDERARRPRVALEHPLREPRRRRAHRLLRAHRDERGDRRRAAAPLGRRMLRRQRVLDLGAKARRPTGRAARARPRRGARRATRDRRAGAPTHLPPRRSRRRAARASPPAPPASPPRAPRARAAAPPVAAPPATRSTAPRSTRAPGRGATRARARAARRRGRARSAAR